MTKTDSPAKLHNRLPVLRAERGLSRQDVAEAVGVNYQTVGYLERGDFNPSLELAFRISEYCQEASSNGCDRSFVTVYARVRAKNRSIP